MVPTFFGTRDWFPGREFFKGEQEKGLVREVTGVMWSGGVLQTKALLQATHLLLCGWVPKRPRGGGLLTYCVPNVPNVLNLNCVRRRYFHWQTHTGWLWVQSEFLPLHGSVAPIPPSWDPRPEFSSKAGRGRLHQWWQGAERGSDLGWGAPPGSCPKGCWGLWGVRRV